MISAHTRGPEGTRALGQAVASLLMPGDVLLLIGGLGAGKTTFVQGLARGLGHEGDVTSPTFTLCHTYAGRLDLVHVDLWRLDRRSEILDLGLDEELENGAVIVAEWGEGAESLFGERALVIRFGSAGEDERDISIELRGASAERSAVLESALGEAV
ncbi:MAG: tRNA (adenosine(37)-N6)-threonylcarbamoyltransferase complex ATPase subunit type 1 TsaE [Acidimicrobiales bacterium]